uniref:Large ribosomal subunit protein uL4m n=1 Tax=Phallusia mammillata TaxID=59560 RepID=A0A6F9DLW3_9ASCI|nr:39S ribosomal protein L4, mitochondrial-like [Phallusia mammillata]
MFQIKLLPRLKVLHSFVRHQHNLTSVKSSLPNNLVLLGKAKDQLNVDHDTTDEVLPPDDNVPVIRKCVGTYSLCKQPAKVWVDSFANTEMVYETAAELNPDIFSTHPRIDVLHDVVKWQKVYREVDYRWARTRAEMGRGRKKPWPQKGTGRVRQGSTVPPFWKKGGIAHGPRGPKSLYYNMSAEQLIKALAIALTIKRVQSDLLIVKDIDVPMPNDVVATQEPLHDNALTLKSSLEEILKARSIDRNSILFVHGTDAPENLNLAVIDKRGWNTMPLVGLNVLSILKHDKLVLHLDILDELEEKLIWNMTRYPWLEMPHNFYKDMPINRDNLEKSLDNM